MIETYVLNIHGPVCIGVRDMLKKPLFANTVKVFHNDLCLETPNCRYVITTFDCISCECLSVCGSTAYTTDDSIPLPLCVCVCVCQMHTLLSGGSRISPRRGANSPGGCQHTILPNFPKNCMKLKEFGPPGGAHVQNFTM